VSNAAIDAVWEYSRAKLGPRLVLLKIADNADDRGYAWPSVRYLARRTKLSRRHVQRAIKSLIAIGELEPVTGPTKDRNSITYRVTLVDRMSPGGVRGCRRGGDISDQKQVRNVALTIINPHGTGNRIPAKRKERPNAAPVIKGKYDSCG
jgi:Helix-turn-helix domain